ncbi:MAG: DUF4124 domain-containing protein [Gammaproteobacteria bacterium]|nr:DUF4124 domain-containing protein [Gammaproteobacteria bacterium]
MNRYTIYIGFLALLLAASAGAADKIYKWTDAHGQVHYSDAPQGNQSAVRTQDSDPITLEATKPGEKPLHPIQRKPPGHSSATTAAATTHDSNGTPTSSPEQRLIQSFEEERHQREEAAARKKHQEEEREQRCHRARDKLRQYESAGYLYDLDPDGNRRALNDSERKTAEEKLKAEIEKFCN